MNHKNHKPYKNRGVLKGETSPQRQTARLLKAQGMTYQQIGDFMGFSRQRAQQLVRPTLVACQQIAAEVGNKCQECGAMNIKLELHHTSYKSGDLVLLCTSCHKKADARMGLTRKSRSILQQPA